MVITCRHVFWDFCMGLDLVRKSSFAIGDTIRLFFYNRRKILYL